MPTNSGKINRLKSKQSFDFLEWFKGKTFTDYRVTDADIAQLATIELKYSVTRYNVQNAWKTTGKVRPQKPEPASAPMTKADIYKLAIEILYKRLGEELPAEWSGL